MTTIQKITVLPIILLMLGAGYYLHKTQLPFGYWFHVPSNYQECTAATFATSATETCVFEEQTFYNAEPMEYEKRYAAVETIPNTWSTYTSSLGFSLRYPTTLQAGAKANKSLLSTASQSVDGTFIGPMVLITLDTPNLQQFGKGTYDRYAEMALNKLPKDAFENLQPPDCTLTDIKNTDAIISKVYCQGEGGPALVAFIYPKGKPYYLFIDGTTGGYSNDTDYDQLQTLQTSSIINQILSSFMLVN
jgi:hypothetical protein